MTGEPMTPEDRALTIVTERMRLRDEVPARGLHEVTAVIAAAIEECRRHAPDRDDYCVACNVYGRCSVHARLFPTLLAAGVPEHELRGEEAAEGRR